MPTCCSVAHAYGPLFLVGALSVVWLLLDVRAEARAVRSDLAELARDASASVAALAPCRHALVALALALAALAVALLR